MNRRQLLRQGIIAGAALGLGQTVKGVPRDGLFANRSAQFPPVRTITSGLKFHWFGYYDKLQFDPTDRYVLSNQVDFEHRTPRPDDVIQIGMVDIQAGDQWIQLGESRAWGWQQGCMLQWIPQSKNKVIWNDRKDGRFISHILNVETRERDTLSMPIYTLSPGGDFALSADFSRIQDLRLGYGYVGLADPYAEDVAPRNSGVFHVDLESRESHLILSLADVAKIPHQGAVLKDVKHYFNHLLIAPDSKRFIVLHRWRKLNEAKTGTVGGFVTRMITANVDGSDVYVLDPSGHTSHFIWKDDEHVCMWTKPKGRPAAFYLFKDKSRSVEIVGKDLMTRNGHNTYIPRTNQQWILNDTYPDKNRNQKPYLFHVPSNRLIYLGEFRSPDPYRGEWRCDTHPRSSNSGRLVCIDSPHTSSGRQLHLIDVGEILDRIG
jgi:hypothetical protein